MCSFFFPGGDSRGITRLYGPESHRGSKEKSDYILEEVCIEKVEVLIFCRNMLIQVNLSEGQPRVTGDITAMSEQKHGQQKVLRFTICYLATGNSQVGYNKYGTGGVFAHSEFDKALERNSLSLPEPRPLPGTTAPELPFVLVGDEAFPLRNSMLRPYGTFLVCLVLKAFKC